MSALCGHVFRLEREIEIIITSTIQKLIFDKSLESTTIISENIGVTILQMEHMSLIVCSWVTNGLLISIVRRYIIRTSELFFPVITKFNQHI